MFRLSNRVLRRHPIPATSPPSTLRHHRDTCGESYQHDPATAPRWKITHKISQFRWFESSPTQNTAQVLVVLPYAEKYSPSEFKRSDNQTQLALFRHSPTPAHVETPKLATDALEKQNPPCDFTVHAVGSANSIRIACPESVNPGSPSSTGLRTTRGNIPQPVHGTPPAFPHSPRGTVPHSPH